MMCEVWKVKKLSKFNIFTSLPRAMKCRLLDLMRPGKLVSILILAVAIGVSVWWLSGDSKRSSLKALSRLEELVSDSNQVIPQDLVILPESAKSKPHAEANQWLREVLRDELSNDGIRELRRSARFGSLTTVFPERASTWAEAAGASPDDCYAFRMDRNGVTAEVVLVPGPNGFRISRCNNVKQMAELP